MPKWPEVQTVIDENRRELVIKGNPDIVEKFQNNNGHIPDDVYDLAMLNFLEIARCDVTFVSSSINKLSHLAQLLLNNNKIEKVPDEITDCSSLKLLDVSYNLITELPENIGKLQNLQTLNASNNKISCLPGSCSELAALSVLNFSSNNFEEFPMSVLNGGASGHVSDFNISHNQIEFLPDEVGNLVSMKQFDMSDNKVKDLPQTLSKILKLKLANYKSNPLKDRRLQKLIETNNSQKSIMDYIRTKGRKPVTSNANDGEEQKSHVKVTKRQQKKNTQEDEKKIDVVRFTMQVLKLNDEEDGEKSSSPLPHIILVTEAVKDVRPYLVACVLKNVDLSGSKFKLFLSIQTDLHEHACGKRTVATIATHDAKYFSGSEICYDARPPSVISIHPLGRVKAISGTRLFRSLKKEAEETRKQKKRNQPTGIHKYLSLLEDKELFPILYAKNEDEKVTVVSLPPLTNAEESKITEKTKDIFVEITSSKSLQDCKYVMDTLLTRMVESGIHSRTDKDFYDDSSEEEEEAENPPQSKSLFIHQVKVVDITGKLKVLYPSKTDLVFDKDLGIQVLRPY